ncbi:MAG: outer membrane protein assembly factor BamC [Betaproteobacteria bacterium]|nr:outer membrane protein assembly factor BamC [Betaproteobacteria bacterium]
MLKVKVICTASLLSLTLAACSWIPGFSNKGPDYRGQGGKIPSLEVPPDLTSPVADDRFVIPDNKATTYSSYNREKTAPAATPSGPTVLTKVEGARIERAGQQRWLVVKATPEKVWPLVREFWKEGGFVLVRDTPEIGIMETDWAEDRSKIKQDFIRNNLPLLDGLYSSGLRDKFRTRLEAGAEPGTTEIYISHRGLEEVYTNADKASTGWQPRASDKELEAEMLNRLIAKFGLSEKAAVVAAAAPQKGDTASTPAAPPRAAFDPANSSILKVSEPFDRTWRRVGLGLDRSGFTVEDRDRSKGLFFVRYIDPDAEAKGSSKGFLDKLAFWRKDDPASKPQYRIYVAEAGGVCNIAVQDAEGKADTSATAKRILTLLLEQLK